MKTLESATDNNVGRKAPENVPETNVGNINGRTPDEIKKGLNCNNIDHCNDCPYDGLDCAKHVDQDALAYIQQLEAGNESKQKRIDELESRLAQVERERDALMESVKGCCETCAFVGDCAKHDPDPTSTGAWWYDDCEEWQWRGVCEENTPDE